MAGQQQGGGMIVGINVTPLVDITLVLLIVFIVTAKLIVAPAVPLDLPKAAHAAEDVQVVFSVSLPLDGAAVVNGAPVTDDDSLLALAQAALAKDADLRAVIQADGAVPHRRVIHVLDVLRHAGIAKVAFGALADEDKTSAP
jgi:biopolymer transport protein ExbD